MMQKLALAAALSLAVSGACAAQPSGGPQDVMIASDDIRLGATLHWPESCPQAGCPAMVLGHGSAPTTRDDVGFYLNIAQELGYAVLAYDKRGNGESGGEYERFSVESSDAGFRRLAGDMAAVTRWLSEQDGIDADNIGLFGGSQAGWIMPLAVHLGAPAGFIVIGEGAAVTAGQEHAHGMVLQARFGSEFSSDIGFEDVHAADLALEAYQGPHGYDPADALAELDTPTLWFFGLRDHVIPMT